MIKNQASLSGTISNAALTIGGCIYVVGLLQPSWYLAGHTWLTGNSWGRTCHLWMVHRCRAGIVRNLQDHISRLKESTFTITVSVGNCCFSDYSDHGLHKYHFLYFFDSQLSKVLSSKLLILKHFLVAKMFTSLSAILYLIGFLYSTK